MNLCPLEGKENSGDDLIRAETEGFITDVIMQHFLFLLCKYERVITVNMKDVLLSEHRERLSAVSRSEQLLWLSLSVTA